MDNSQLDEQIFTFIFNTTCDIYMHFKLNMAMQFHIRSGALQMLSIVTPIKEHE
jgi:hypothetical protein